MFTEQIHDRFGDMRILFCLLILTVSYIFSILPRFRCVVYYLRYMPFIQFIHLHYMPFIQLLKYYLFIYCILFAYINCFLYIFNIAQI